MYLLVYSKPNPSVLCWILVPNLNFLSALCWTLAGYSFSNNGRMWALAFDGGDGRHPWQRWTIETAFNGGGGGVVRWRQQPLTVFDGVGDGL